MFTLAHLSDIHLSPMPRPRRSELMSKRMLGYVNWHRGRKLVHRREILDLLTRDIIERKPDHIAVTGDLVNLGLPEEFLRAAEWLHHLGPPEPRDGDPRQSRRLCQAASRGRDQALAALHGIQCCRRIARADAADAVSLRAALRRRRHRGALLGRPHHAVRRRRQDRLAPARPSRRGPGAARARRPVPRRLDPPPSPSRARRAGAADCAMPDARPAS